MPKKPASAPGNFEADVAQALDRLTGMLGIVDDTLTRIRSELTWLINNRDELPALRGVPAITGASPEAPQRRPANVPETIHCFDCEIASSRSLAAALRDGWTDLTADGRADESYLGLCPHCFKYGSSPATALPAQAPEQPPKQGSGAPVSGEPPASNQHALIPQAETLACTDCDAPSPPSLAAALQAGWTELAPDNAERWNFIGLCPDCLAHEYTLPTSAPMPAPIDEPKGDDGPQDTLF